MKRFISLWTVIAVTGCSLGPADNQSRVVRARIKALGDSDPGVRSEAAEALGHMGDFYEVITGRSAGNLGVRYTLIHADPAQVQ